VIAGSRIDEDYYDRAVALIAELGLEDAVSMVGRLPAEKLRPLYQRCLLFVFPSTAETFGLPLVEAMACGAPIASSNSTAMPEIVGDAALLFDPFDTAAMVEALCRLIESPELRARLSQAALQRAAQFSWRQTARQTADVLCRAADNRAPA
jgi:glycosyltransferase involved in cell wall biosynthesis